MKSSDKKYREWIQKQQSCISGNFSEFVNGEGRCIAAHVRRSNRSGTGFKALYACVPLTKAEHDYQHHFGEYACLRQFMHPREFVIEFSEVSYENRIQMAKKWFDRQVVKYFREWEKI